MITGAALKYDVDDINTDVIWPGKYTYVRIPPEEMGGLAMETFDPAFAQKAREHNILVVGGNFGCGSSREQAAECLKHAGITAVIARSFARTFYRNSINIGLPVVQCAAAVSVITTGDEVAIDLAQGRLVVRGESIAFPRYPEFILELVTDGGLINHLRKGT